ADLAAGSAGQANAPAHHAPAPSQVPPLVALPQTVKDAGGQLFRVESMPQIQMPTRRSAVLSDDLYDAMKSTGSSTQTTTADGVTNCPATSHPAGPTAELTVPPCDPQGCHGRPCGA